MWDTDGQCTGLCTKIQRHFRSVEVGTKQGVFDCFQRRSGDTVGMLCEGSTGSMGGGENCQADTMDVGTPDAGTTQAVGSRVDPSNYSTYEEMEEAYVADIAEIEAGDKYGNNIVDLYNLLNYIGADGTEKPVWVRILMGAAEGDMSMFSF